MVMKIILAKPRGFCGGVDRAIGVVEKALEKFGAPLYVRHQIVHNDHVVKDFEGKGVVFVEDLSSVPAGSVVVLSAHGSAPTVFDEAKERELKVIDATCPLVTKVHDEAMRFHNEGYSIVLIGHKGHQEVVGTMGYAPMQIVESVSAVANVEGSKIAVLTQTTLSVDDTAKIISALHDRFLDLVGSKNICYATTNRQGAVKELARQCGLVLVVGSVNSSNSNRLVETAKKNGCNAYLINDKTEIDNSWFSGVEVLGLTSGASVPDSLVQEVVEFVKELDPGVFVETLNYVEENVHFSMPEELSD